MSGLIYTRLPRRFVPTAILASVVPRKFQFYEDLQQSAGIEASVTAMLLIGCCLPAASSALVSRRIAQGIAYANPS